MNTTDEGLFSDPKERAVTDEHTPAIQFEGQNWYHDKATDRFYLYSPDHSQIAMLVRTPEGFQLHTRAYGETEWKEQATHGEWEDALREAERHATEYQQDLERREYITRRQIEIEGRESGQGRGGERSGHRGPTV